VARTAGDLDQPWWFQLYVQRDRGFTANLVARATAAGASALVLTVDTPTLGARDRDKRANLALENGVRYPILADAPLLIDSQTPAHRRVYNPLLAPDITWDDLAWLIDTATIPVLVKGVLTG
jgi:4-hydroxymandelate oxidase